MRRRLLIDFSLVADGGSRTYARGFTTALAQLAPRLIQSGIEVFVLLPQEELAAEAARLDAAGCTTLLADLSRAGTWRSRAAQQWLLPTWARRIGATDLFVPRETAPLVDGALMVVLARNLLYWDRMRERQSAMTVAQMTLARSIAHRGVRKARRVIAPTRWLASHLQRKDVTVIPYGSDIELLSVADKEGCWLAGSGRLEAVTISTVFPHKRLERAIEIVSSLARFGIEVRLSIWGPTPDRTLLDGLRAMALRGLGYDPFRGPLPFEQRARVLRRSDVLIMSSARESFGHPLIEALRTSTVVVGPASPLVDELCRGAAITFDEQNPQTAASELLSALPRLSSIADAGRSVGESYSWEACVEQTLLEILGASERVGQRPSEGGS